jgi:bifunctional oligoribonuclease and PAP phosphatase NrnA
MTIEDVKKLLGTPKKIAITSHRNPDGDAIGSSLGLFHYLEQLGHTVDVAFPSDFPPIFSWMPSSERITIFDDNPLEVKEMFEAADIIFALDYNALDRIDKMGDLIRPLSNTPKIMIDHHREPEAFVDYMLSDITASSTSELVFDFVNLLNDGEKINKTVGECLYTGIAALLERGVDDYRLQDLINNCLPERNLRLLGHCLANRMEVLPEFQTGIIWLSKKDYETFDIQRGDTEGVVNHILSMGNVKMACFMTEQPTIVKISLRSKGNLNVQEICRDHFKGGGHKNAAGGFSYANLKTTMEKFKNLLPTYQEKILASSF